MSKICAECGAPLSDSALEGYCPKCLLALANNSLGGASARQERERPELNGHLFGDYEMLEQIGEGGMGVVFKARQRTLNRIVAVKLLRSGVFASKAEVKRFLLEAQAAARLQHPNIVAIHGAGEHNGQRFFSMAYVEGRTLSDTVDRTPLSPARAAAYTKTLASAVHYAHSMGVLHRDLKPGNVLVDEHDQLRITDFGLAKELKGGADSLVSDPTASGDILGTPSYMSPEQAAGDRKRLGPPTDIYALGAILYDLLTARPPFRADSAAETIRQVIELDPAPPRLLNAKVDRDLQTICLKCLAKQPAQRYETAQDLADDLGRFLTGEAIRARPPNLLARAFHWAKRKPAAAGVIGFAALLLLVLAAAGSWSIEDSRDSVAAAPGLAKGVARDFDKLGKQITEIASQPELFPLITNKTWHGSGTWTDQTNRANPLVNFLVQQSSDRTASSFEYYLLLSPRGEVLAYFHPGEGGLTNALPLLWKRDYFRGATNLETGRVHIGHVYKARSDDRFKIALTTPVRDAGSNLLAVVAGMLGTASTAEPTGIQTLRTKTVLISPLDPSSGLSDEELNQTAPDPRLNNPPNYVVFWHPAYKKGQTNIVAVEDPGLVKHLKAVSTDSGTSTFVLINYYNDPVGLLHRAYAGAWVAGLSRVPDAPLIEVYQARDRVLTVLMIGLVLVGLGLVASLVAHVRKWILARRNIYT